MIEGVPNLEVPITPEIPTTPELSNPLISSERPAQPNIETVDHSVETREGNVSVSEDSSEGSFFNIDHARKEIVDLENSRDITKQKLADIREEIGVPSSSEEPPSVKPIQERIDALKEKISSEDLSRKRSSVGEDTTVESHEESGSFEVKAKTILESGREALEKMPDEKTGIVLGAGDNAKFWSERGWKTLDINPEAGADITMDVNDLSDAIPPHSQDFLFSERMKFDPDGRDGAGPARLLQQANNSLKDKGELIIKTVDFLDKSDPGLTIPKSAEFMKRLKEHGFEVEVERGKMELEGVNNNERVQPITYYARKVSEGYRPIWSGERVQKFSNSSFYERLGIPQDANADEINSAYKRLIKTFHPDVAPKDSDYSNYPEIDSLLGEAKQALTDPNERRRYDAKLSEEGSIDSRSQTENPKDRSSPGIENYIDKNFWEGESARASIEARVKMRNLRTRFEQAHTEGRRAETESLILQMQAFEDEQRLAVAPSQQEREQIKYEAKMRNFRTRLEQAHAEGRRAEAESLILQMQAFEDEQHRSN
jgi:curved DNA-binding protein CbpA